MKDESKMHVAMYYNNRDVRLEQVPVPKIGPGELLIKTRASGICGSDLMEWYRIQKAVKLFHMSTSPWTRVTLTGKNLNVSTNWPRERYI